MKIQSYRSTGSGWDYCHHKMGFPLPSSLVSTFLAPPADSKPLRKHPKAQLLAWGGSLISTCLINEWHPNFAEGLTQALLPLPELRESGLPGHTIGNGWFTQSSQWHTHASHALGRQKRWVTINTSNVWNLPGQTLAFQDWCVRKNTDLSSKPTWVWITT